MDARTRAHGHADLALAGVLQPCAGYSPRASRSIYSCVEVHDWAPQGNLA